MPEGLRLVIQAGLSGCLCLYCLDRHTIGLFESRVFESWSLILQSLCFGSARRAGVVLIRLVLSRLCRHRFDFLMQTSF